MQEARDKDRDAATELVRAACAAGQIIEADRDMRIEQIKAARTLDDIATHTRDLQPSAPAPVVESPADLTPTEFVPLAALTPQRSVFKYVVPIALVGVVAVIFIGGILAVVGAGVVGSVVDEVTPEEASAAAVLSVDGYQDLLAVIEDETGSTTAFSAVLYPTYASVELPVGANGERSESWYWDGENLIQTGKSTSSAERIDLSKVDPAVIVDLVDQVKRKLDDATSWYAIVRAPDTDRAVVWAYATNEYGETGYLGARRNGTVTYDSTKP